MRWTGLTAGKILRLGYDTSLGKILDEVTRGIDFEFGLNIIQYRLQLEL